MSGYRIVIVEDNRADVLLVREALELQRLEFRLEHFVNGEDAAKAISEMPDPPALFLVDLNVPRVPGFDLLRLIRACPRVAGVPVAILTSSQSPADKTWSEHLGADAYIVKPRSYHEFMQAVGAAVARMLPDNSPGSQGALSALPRRQPETCSRRARFAPRRSRWAKLRGQGDACRSGSMRAAGR